jgi:hypothetical protein
LTFAHAAFLYSFTFFRHRNNKVCQADAMSDGSGSAHGFSPDTEGSDQDAGGKGKGKDGGGKGAEAEDGNGAHIPLELPDGAEPGSFMWGDFLISPIRRSRGMPQTGWGVTCGLHWGQRDGSICGTECKTSFQYTVRGVTLSDAESLLQCKRWILKGFDITNDIGDDRYQHIFVHQIRKVGPQEGETDEPGPVPPPGFVPFRNRRRRLQR